MTNSSDSDDASTRRSRRQRLLPFDETPATDEAAPAVGDPSNPNTVSLLFPPEAFDEAADDASSDDYPGEEATAEVDKAATVAPEQPAEPAPVTAAHAKTRRRDDLSRALFPTAPIATIAPTVAPAAEAEVAAAPEATPAAAPAAAPEPSREWTDEKNPATALTWLDKAAVTGPVRTAASASAPDLLTGARFTPGWRRARVLAPIGIVAALCGTYVGTTLLWPLTSVAPTVQTRPVDIAAVPAASITWPTDGSAAVGVQGLSTLASTTETAPIASISKVVSVLMVLDELPLKPGEQGPRFSFTQQDSWDFWSYRRANQSSLDVPVGGSLTEYQMLQGVLLGSANNYIDRLSKELWGSDSEFAEAAAVWLADHGIEDVVLESPSGFNDRNIATPESLIKIGELAMKHPVFAEIVGTQSAEIPGAGLVLNSNEMLADTGVVGVKTGTLYGDWNLLTAKDIPLGDTTVRVFTAVLGQDDSESRVAVTRSLFAEVEKALVDQPVSVPKGTVVGHVTTLWGDRVDVVTDADVRVALWNGAGATASTSLELGDETDAGAKVGTLTADGPLDDAETSISLTKELTQPSAWWRLTHPLELFGFDKR